MEIERQRNAAGCGCSTPLKACLVVGALVFVLLIGGLIWTLRLPAVRSLIRCRSNMTQIGEAIRRYHDVTGSYPPELAVLRRDYLKDPSVLRCPLDRSPGDAPSYLYHRLRPDSPERAVVLECDRHRLKPGKQRVKLLLLKNGQVSTRS